MAVSVLTILCRALVNKTGNILAQLWLMVTKSTRLAGNRGNELLMQAVRPEMRERDAGLLRVTSWQQSQWLLRYLAFKVTSSSQRDYIIEVSTEDQLATHPMLQ